MALTLQQAQTSVRTASGLDMLAGLWLVLAPFLLTFTGITAATINSVVLGALILILAGSREFGEGYRHAWPSWINVIVGAWLIIAPFALGFSASVEAMWSHIIAGAAVVVLALWSALSTPGEHQQG